ncbi:spermatogenesis-associated protein 31D4-like [Arvicola amphibius]|uniref:spermatogenesis-associated protein 31D4-like n=1 Tax=Arvicola amphibius TaxID=1047088 RepID=UPI0018E3494E|nr:spermatogenesis-associated protein 31D4-like [Arvicola amphibius]
MEKVLSFLNSTTEPWLRLGYLPSAFPDIYPKCIFLSAVGVLLLYLRYLLLKPFLPTLSNQTVRKQQGEARKRRRASFKEFRIFHRETQERRKLLSVVQSPFGQLYDASHFRRVLCPDPHCDVCNEATAKVSHLLSGATPEDAAASASSVASTASVTETSFTLSPPLSPSPLGCQISSLPPPPLPPPPPPPSVISTLEDTPLCTPQGDSPPSEPVLLTSVDFPPPLGHIPPHPLPTLPQTEESLQLETSPSLVDSPSEQILNATTNKEACGGMSEFLPSQSECLVNRHSSEAFLGGQPTIYFPMPGKPSFPNPKVLALLERQDQSQSDLLMLRDEKEKAETFQFEKTLKTWKEISEPASGSQSSGVSLPLRSSEGVLQELMVHQELVQMQTSKDRLEPKVIQHFWGLPYLHSESVNTVTTLSTRSSTCIWFNSTPDSSVLIHPIPLSLPESQPQILTQSQSQSVLLQPPVPVTPSSSQSQLRICEVYFHTSQDKTKALLQSGIRHLEWNVTTEEERVWALPAKVQTSQTKVCLLPSTPSLVRQSSNVHTPRSVPPNDFPLSDAFRKKLEYHLRKRLILQRRGLPQRIFKSQPWMHPDLVQSSMSSYGLSGISFFQPQDSKDWQDTVLNQPGSSQESLSLDGKMVEAQGQSSEIVQRYPRGNSKGALDNGLQSDSETNLQRHPGSLSGKPSGTSQVSQCREKLKTALQKPLVSHLNEASKGQRAGTASRSGNCPLPLTSRVDNEQHAAQRQSRSDNKDRHTKSTDTVTKPVLHQASTVLDNTSLKESEGNEHSPDMPRISTEAAPAPLGKQLDSGKTVLGPQGAKVNSKNIFVADKINNIVKGGQLSVLQPQPTKILNTNQGKSTQGADGNTTKAQNTLVTGRALKEITCPQKSQTSDCNSQVSREGKFKPESRLPIQTLGPPRDKLPASDEFAYRHFLMSDRSPSRGPMMASQVQRQEPRMPPHVLGKGQSKDISPSVKKVWPAPWKMEELGARVPRPGTLQANGKSCHAQVSPTQGRHGEKPTQPLPGKALTPPEHQFRKHVKHFLQWLSPDRRGKVQETFPQKGSSPPSPGQDPELFKGRATFPGNTIAQRAMRDPGKVSKEQLRHRQIAADTMRHPVPSPLTKPVIAKPRSQSWVLAEPAQGRPFQHQATCPKVLSSRPYNQATAVVGQRRWVEDRVSQSQKSVFLQPNPPAPYRGPELHRNLVSRRAGQLPQTAPPFAVGTVLADLSRLCEQKILAQNFSGKGFLPQK